MKKKIVALALSAAAALGMTACSSDADVASENLSKAADNFEVMRHVVFFNGITDKYLLEIVGLCSLGNYDSERRLSVTCKVEGGKFEKHFLGLSDNVSYFVQQVGGVDVSTSYHRVVFKPQELIPDVDIRTEAALPENQD